MKQQLDIHHYCMDRRVAKLWYPFNGMPPWEFYINSTSTYYHQFCSFSSFPPIAIGTAITLLSTKANAILRNKQSTAARNNNNNNNANDRDCEKL